MRYFLKKDLPGIKAGVEMEKWTNEHAVRWHPKNAPSEKFYIPPSELSDWIEEIDPKWKPEMDEMYFFPTLDEETPKFDSLIWGDSPWDNARLAHNIVCPTKELAIELADRMIETAKKFWEEKK